MTAKDSSRIVPGSYSGSLVVNVEAAGAGAANAVDRVVASKVGPDEDAEARESAASLLTSFDGAG
jgi:hypothetical protein